MKSKLILMCVMVAILLCLFACSPATKQASVEVSCDDFYKQHHISQEAQVLVDGSLTVSTRGLIGGKELALVKPTVRIINCARGELIDEEALAKAIEEKKIAGAAVDVYCKEPATDCVLFKCGNIIHTPHLAASTTEAQSLAATTVAEQIVDELNGRPPKYQVNNPSVKR